MNQASDSEHFHGGTDYNLNLPSLPPEEERPEEWVWAVESSWGQAGQIQISDLLQCNAPGLVALSWLL